MDLPVIVLDNDFREPDLDRYLERFERYDPSVAVLGDAYTPEEAEALDEIVWELTDEYPFKEYVVVPKCRESLEVLDGDVVLGYPMGYSDLHADDFSNPSDWRSRRIHLLGASPTKQYDVIQDLTQPTLTGDPPADIAGLDWNGVQGVAYKGEYWSREGWQDADQLSIRETVRESLKEIKTFWQDKGVWPDTEPIDLYGEAVEKPDELIFMDRGGDPIPDRENLENAYVDTYQYNGRNVTWAFQDSGHKGFIEYREGLT